MAHFETMNMDAWADGQVGSKIWLCQELEAVLEEHVSGPVTVWILGGWYATLGFLLFAREKVRLHQVRSFDIDEKACAVADLVNKNWEIQEWKFKAFVRDCNELDYSSHEFGDLPDVIINTSCEHFELDDWWKTIPEGKLVVLQSNDMPHEEHVHNLTSLDEFRQAFHLSEELYAGKKTFRYPDWEFTRFMRIGKK